MALTSVCIGVLGWALGFSALAAPDAPIPLDQLGAVAGQQYQGDALGVSATPEGAQLRCVFQRLTGRVTPEGLWLESTEPGGGQLRLRATAIHREAGDWSADIPVGLYPPNHQPAPGATGAWIPQAGSPSDSLAEWQGGDTTLWVRPALSTLNPQPSTLPPTGTVSVQDNLVRFRRPGLVEEYAVSMDGLRQDFVVLERPPLNSQLSTLNPAAEPLRVDLELTGARAEALPNGVRLTLDGSGRELAYSRLRVTDATGRELPARMEVATHSAFGLDRGRAGSPLPAAGLERGDDWEWCEGGAQRSARPTRLAVLVDDADAVYPVRIDPTFSDADWVSLNAGMPGANYFVLAFTTDENGNVYAGGYFTFIGTVEASIAKWDGSTWSSLGTVMQEYFSYGVRPVSALAASGTNLYVGGTFIKIGEVAATNIARWNGTTWSALGLGLDHSVNALALSGNTLYAGGTFTNAGGLRVNGIARWNGSSWSALSSGMGGGHGDKVAVHALAVSGTDLYAGGSFLTAGGVEVRNIAKWNGSSWSPLGSGTTLMGPVYALALSGTDLYAAGQFLTVSGVEARRIAKWDGSAWSALGSGISGPPDSDPYGGAVYALKVSGDTLYAGGSFTNAGGVPVANIAKWNGDSWSTLGAGVNRDVYALAASGTDLYAGGRFTTAGGVLADFIAKWNGTSWSALGSGMNGDVYALAVSGTNLYVGGSFTTVGGVAANRIVRWNGSTWSPLGSGMDGVYVSALAVLGGDLYAGGWFTTAGGVTVNGIARWNGHIWSVLGAGVNGTVYALAVTGNLLYAGGEFTTAGGVTANRIAGWNGSTWSALGSGMNDWVYALAVSGNTLYVGGDFTTAGGATANRIARWNGSSWSALGAGVNGTVYAVALSGNELYAGGRFTTAGGLPASKIAKWNGSTWSALGPGMLNNVLALAVSGTNLYAGGEFTTAGAVFANYIAKWDGNAWSALGSGLTGSPDFGSYRYTRARALAADDAGHLFVGGSFLFAGTNVSPFIAQANLTPPPMVIEGIRVDAGVVTLDCRGAAGGVCAVQRAADVRFTENLTTLHTTNAPPDGRFTCTDATPPATTAFYRLVRP